MIAKTGPMQVSKEKWVVGKVVLTSIDPLPLLGPMHLIWQRLGNAGNGMI